MLLDRLTSQHANVGNGERVGSVVAGLGLALAGLTRHWLTGFTLVGIGAALVQRGVRGRCPFYGALGINHHTEARTADEAADPVDQASMDSFPASDSPSRHSIT
ncbi:MAG: DUF2892 domain-containing protein [Myxococcota bacterium]